MKMNGGIIEIDIHGMNQYQARMFIDSQLKKAKTNVYRLRIIHGFHQGDALRRMVRQTYRHHPKVIKIEIGLNPGITDLVLRNII